MTAKDAVNLLQSRLNKVFGEAEETIRGFYRVIHLRQFSLETNLGFILFFGGY